MPLAGCIAVPSPWAPSTSRNGFIASGSSAMCDWPSVPLYTRHIFGMRIVLSAGRRHQVGQRCGQEAGLERGDLHGCGSYNGRRRHRGLRRHRPGRGCQGAWASLNTISSLASLGSLGAPVMTLRGSSLGEPVVAGRGPVFIEVCVPDELDTAGAVSSMTMITSSPGRKSVSTIVWPPEPMVIRVDGVARTMLPSVICTSWFC